MRAMDTSPPREARSADTSTTRGRAAAARAEGAAERAARAAQRVAELRTRLESLTRGEGPSRTSVAAATAAFNESLALASDARRSAADAFIRAAHAHRAAATAAQLRGDPRRAQWHRELAASDERSAAALRAEQD